MCWCLPWLFRCWCGCRWLTHHVEEEEVSHTEEFARRVRGGFLHCGWWPPFWRAWCSRRGCCPGSHHLIELCRPVGLGCFGVGFADWRRRFDQLWSSGLCRFGCVHHGMAHDVFGTADMVGCCRLAVAGFGCGLGDHGSRSGDSTSPYLSISACAFRSVTYCLKVRKLGLRLGALLGSAPEETFEAFLFVFSPITTQCYKNIYRNNNQAGWISRFVKCFS